MYSILLCAQTLSNADSYPSMMVNLLQKALAPHWVDTINISKPEWDKKNPIHKQSLIEAVQAKNMDLYDMVMFVGDQGFTKGKYPKNIFKDVPVIEFNPTPAPTTADYVLLHMSPTASLEKMYIGCGLDLQHLYVEERKDDHKFTVWVDHNSPRDDKTKEVLEYLEKMQTSHPIRVLHQNNMGVTQNVFERQTSALEYHKYDYDIICSLYRKADVYFMTHRETQGLNAVEMAAVGAQVLLQPGMLPKSMADKIPHQVYESFDDIDWPVLMEATYHDRLDKHLSVYNEFGLDSFRIRLLNALERIKKDENSDSDRGLRSSS